MPGRILVVDDLATNRIVMKVRLAEACYDVLQADGGLAALDIARREHPDLILLDVVMADLDGISVCRALKSDPATADIPIIMVTAGRNTDEKVQALAAGAEEFLSKPLDEATLLARVRSLLRARETARELALRDGTRRALGFAEPAQQFTRRGSIALLGGKLAQAMQWKNMLSGQIRADLQIMTRAEALAQPDADRAPDLFVIATDLDRAGDGLRLLTDLRSRPATRHSAIVMVVPISAQDDAAMALDLGANDLLSLPCDAREMALRMETQLARKHQADLLRAAVRDELRLAMTDPLTGLFNRRYAMPHLDAIAHSAAHTGRSFALMLLDIDRFKSVNDQFGHAAGDCVLQSVARVLTDNLRPVDLIARIGGEEFLIVLPETSAERAIATAERLRQNVCSSTIPLPGKARAIQISASIGVAISDRTLTDTKRLFALADDALYAAKAEGRNRVTIGKAA